MKAWAKPFYTNRAWQETREAYMLSQQWICERCQEPAKVCHHKTWLTPKNINDPYITLGWDNLEALCQECHNIEHHKKERTGRYTFDKDGNVIPSGSACNSSIQNNDRAQQSPL